MLAVPPAILDILNLHPGTEIGLAVQKGRLVIEPRRKPRYTLDELLTQCNSKARRNRKDREWVTGKPTGNELI